MSFCIYLIRVLCSTLFLDLFYLYERRSVFAELLYCTGIYKKELRFCDRLHKAGENEENVSFMA